MASLKILKHKIKNIRSIQKITQSMKMVSSAKYAKMERILKSVKPFGTGTSNFYRSNFKEPEVTISNDLFLITTSDRGLCGSVHTQACRTAIKELELKKQDREKIRIVCIGDKARSVFQYRYAKSIILVVSEIGRKPPLYLDASKIFNEIGKFKYFYGKMFYNEHKSRISYKTSALSVYDIAAVKLFANLNAFDDTEYEDLQSYVEFSTASLLFYALLENSCSELSARVTAMEAASKNCNEMLNKLYVTYNRVRQSVITRELIEVISGASVVNG